MPRCPGANTWCCKAPGLLCRALQWFQPCLVHGGTVTSVTSEPFSQRTPDSWGHAKAGRQVCSKPSTWEGRNSTEEKEQAQCSVLACVDKQSCGGWRKHLCVSVGAEGAPRKTRRAHQLLRQSWRVCEHCGSYAGWWGIPPHRGEYPQATNGESLLN